MAMSIKSRLDDQLISFKRDTYKEPVAIYISVNLFIQLTNELSSISLMRDHIDLLRGLKIQYKGIPIFRIVEQDQLFIQ